MRSLTLTYCRDRVKFGSAVACQPSSFIKELPAEEVETVDLQKLLSAPVSDSNAKSGFARMRAAITAAV